MNIVSVACKPRRILLTVFDGFRSQWSLHYTDLWDLSIGLSEILAAHGIVAVRAGAIPVLKEKYREALQITSLYIQDQREMAREIKGRIAEGGHVAGGLWYAEITVNGIANDCSFNTVEEFFRIVDTIVMREAGIMIGQDNPRTVKGLVGHG